MRLSRYVGFGSLKRFRTLRGAIFLFLIVGSVCHSQNCGTGDVRQDRENSLRRSGIAFLDSISRKDMKTLLGDVSDRGLVFGVDKTRLSRDELRNQFMRHVGAYCLFFSTACISHMGNFKGLEPDEFLSQWKISYFDWLALNKSHTTRAGLSDDAGVEGCEGNFYAEAQAGVKSAPNQIELYFYFEKGRWWLVGTVAGVP